MTSYSRDPVDRLEGLVRCLQALFLKRGDPSYLLSKRVASFLARNQGEYEFIENNVDDSYSRIRSKVSHGNIMPSSVEVDAMRMIPYVENYCRRSIYFAIGLEKVGDSSFMTNIRPDFTSSAIRFTRDAKVRADRTFWQNPIAYAKTKDGMIVHPLIWPEDVVEDDD